MPRLILGQEESEFKIGLQIRIPDWSLATHRKIYNIDDNFTLVNTDLSSIEIGLMQT